MTTTLLRRTAVAAVTSLALVSLAGCGDKDSDQADEPSSSTSPADDGGTSATEDPSGTPTASSTSSALPSDDPGLEAFIDAYQQALEGATTAHVSMTLQSKSVGSLDLNGEADFAADPPEFAFTFKDPKSGKRSTYVIADGAMYIPVPGTHTFYKTDLSASPISGASDNFLDPRAMIDTLRKGITGVEDRGDEDVDGQSLHHFAVSVDPSALLDEAGMGGSGQPQTSLPGSLQYDVYLDGDGRLTLIKADLGDQIGKIEVHYTKWGEPVDIKVPTGKQVKTLPVPSDGPPS